MSHFFAAAMQFAEIAQSAAARKVLRLVFLADLPRKITLLLLRIRRIRRIRRSKVDDTAPCRFLEGKETMRFSLDGEMARVVFGPRRIERIRKDVSLAFPDVSRQAVIRKKISRREKKTL
jgi:hypothetical protein